MFKFYKMFYLILFFIVSLQVLKSDSILSERYHTYNEIDSILYYGGDSFLAKLDMVKIVKIYPSSEWIGKLAEQNFADWNMDNPFELVPDYTAPFLSN